MNLESQLINEESCRASREGIGRELGEASGQALAEDSPASAEGSLALAVGSPTSAEGSLALVVGSTASAEGILTFMACQTGEGALRKLQAEGWLAECVEQAVSEKEHAASLHGFSC